MKKIKWFILACVVSGSLLFSSCEKSDSTPDPITWKCDIKWKYDGKYYHLYDQLFAGTPAEVEAQKNQVIINFKSLGYTNISIYNCEK